MIIMDFDDSNMITSYRAQQDHQMNLFLGSESQTL